MTLLRSFPMLAYGLVLLSITAVCTAQRNVGLLVVSGVLATISWYVTEGPRGRTLPRWVSSVLVIAFTLWVFADLVQRHGDFLRALGQYAVLLTLVKLYERRTARDYAHMLTLSLLLMMTACLQSNDLLFGVMLVAYVVLGLYVLLLYQLYYSFESARDERKASIPPEYRLVPELKPVTGRHDVLGFRLHVVGVGLICIVVSAIVFVVFPRDVGANMLGRFEPPSRSRGTGFTWNVDLNAGGRITESRARVLTLQVLDSDGRSLEMSGPVYLRGATLNVYQTRGSWISSTAEHNGHRMYMVDSSPVMLGSSRREISADDLAQALTQRIVLNRPIDDVAPIFSMYTPLAVATKSPAVIVYDQFTQTIRTGDRSGRIYEYEVRAAPIPSEQTLSVVANRVPARIVPNWFTDAQRHRTLLNIADEQLQRAGVDVNPPSEPAEIWGWNQRVASALTQYLHSGEFTYVTDLSDVVYPNARTDPIIRFLTHTKRGHCEFFASALAALCHVKGIPSRLVVGYVAYDFDQVARQYTVIEANAHAWVEVATGTRRWSTFDPTPPATLAAIHRNRATLADQMRWAYQRIEGNWSSSIVDFNSDAQANLARSLNQTWSNRAAAVAQALRDWAERVNNFFNVGPGGYIWMGTVALALIIAVIALIKLMKRTLLIRRNLHLHHFRGRQYQRMVRQLGFYLDMLEVLARRGMPKPPGQPPLEFARSVSLKQPAAGAMMEQIVKTFYEGRYGGRNLTAEQVQQARSLVQELAGLIKPH